MAKKKSKEKKVSSKSKKTGKFMASIAKGAKKTVEVIAGGLAFGGLVGAGTLGAFGALRILGYNPDGSQRKK